MVWEGLALTLVGVALVSYLSLALATRIPQGFPQGGKGKQTRSSVRAGGTPGSPWLVERTQACP